MEVKYDPNQIIQFWCQRWHIKELPRLEYRELRGMMGTLGEDKEKRSVIILDTAFHPENRVNVSRIYLLHELRHYYQKKIYRRVYDWWTRREADYVRYYKTGVCVIEEDANIFAWTEGKKNGDILLRDFNALLLHGELGSVFEPIRDDVTHTKRAVLEAYKQKVHDLELRQNLSEWRDIKERFRRI